MGASIDKVIIGKIRVKTGDEVKKGDILFDIVTDKATFDIEADATGTILQLDCKEGEELDVLTVIGYIGDKNEAISKKDQVVQHMPKVQLKVTPRAKKLARENNIDIEKAFFGSDKEIIKEEDILEILHSGNIEKDYILAQLSPRKKAEIAALSQTRNYLYSSVTIQIPTKRIKKRVRKFADRYKIRLSMNQYIYYCTASILLDFPNINAFYSDEGIRQYKNVNLGIAMNPDAGLIVPVIKNANKLSIVEFTAKLSGIFLKVIKNEIRPEDFQGGTFTITDLSLYNAFDFIPIINKDQSSILGINAEYDSCKYEKGKLIYDPKINLTLAFDHRVMDGKYALQFLQKLKDTLMDSN